jgi:hypothetical protein
MGAREDEDIETLRLLRAFAKIKDPAKRREIIALAEALTKSDPDKKHPSR